ncbi:MAG: tetraether lipid synthase Tes, partial [Candidatus Kryptoniota bacterium]
GCFEDVYYGDSGLYHRFMRHLEPTVSRGGCTAEKNDNCPYDCGLCSHHKSSTVLANIDITNACNYKCPTCFADTATGRTVFNPSIKQISQMMDTLRQQDPPCGVIQFSGGEPTIRKDFFKIAQLARDKGFNHIQVATNGRKLSEDPDYPRKLLAADVTTVYLQFDGVTPEPYLELRGFNALPEKLKAIEHLKNHGPLPNAVLVPTITKGVNDRQLGDIVRFAANNMEVVRGINFQPVSFTGRISRDELLKKRITIPDVICALEEQLDGQITSDDFLPIPVFAPLFELLRRNDASGQYPYLNTHPSCGAWTYLFKEGKKLIPLNRLISTEAVFELVASLKKVSRAEILTKVATQLPKLVRAGTIIHSRKILKLLKTVILKGSYRAASEFHDSSVLFIGSMHFMDPYNFDCERSERCCIHYVTPDNKIIPFCSYNTIYREKYLDKYSRKIAAHPVAVEAP